ncbi:MAG: NADH-quinone oxidoreductase subunit K [Fimbriimonadaceae bacterium]|nr:NADH-quinone oxidoreductase subunit K [Fimbriimonadaceae bacterium]
MTLLLAIVIGALYAGGVYMMLRKTVVKLLIGLAMIGNAANLLIFVSSSVVRSHPPIVPKGSSAVPAPYADPLTQALILTAIVIGFAVLAFALALVKRVYGEVGSLALEEMTVSDE